jgi:HlyD family secretion protein
MSRRTILIAGIAVLVVVIGAVAAFAYFGPLNKENTRVTTAEIKTRSVVKTVEAFGRANPSVEISIRPEVSGEITELYVEEGDVVRAGDPLVRLRDDDYRAAVQQRRASVFEAQANLAAAQADSVRAVLQYRRQQRLFEQGAVSAAEWEEAQADRSQAISRVDAARSGVAQARADLNRALDLARQTRINAPIDGVVTLLNVEAGERVLGTMRVEGTEMMRIGGPDAMEFVVQIPEDEIRRIEIGDSAEIETESYGEQLLQGTVVEIANAARMGSGGIGSAEQPEYPVRLRVTSPHEIAARLTSLPVQTAASSESAPMEDASTEDASTEDASTEDAPTGGSRAVVLRPGMSGEVRIRAQTSEDVIAVPSSAVTIRNLSRVDSTSLADYATLLRPPTGADDDLRNVVFVRDGNRARLHEVATGLKGGGRVEIASGLDASHRVIAGPKGAVARNLSPGSLISEKTHVTADEY